MELLSTWVHEICPRCTTLYIYQKWFRVTHASCLLAYWLASKYVWNIFASVDSLKCCTAVESWTTVKLCEYYNYVSCISSKLVGFEQTVWKRACSSKNVFYVPLFSALNFLLIVSIQYSVVIFYLTFKVVFLYPVTVWLPVFLHLTLWLLSAVVNCVHLCLVISCLSLISLVCINSPASPFVLVTLFVCSFLCLAGLLPFSFCFPFWGFSFILDSSSVNNSKSLFNFICLHVLHTSHYLRVNGHFSYPFISCIGSCMCYSVSNISAHL